MTHSLMQRLRAETREAHDQIEQVPFTRALAAGHLPIDAYVVQLRCYERLHAALDTHCAHSTHGAIARVWQPELEKGPHLAADLAFLRREARPLACANDATERAVHEIDEAAALAPRLLGWLYVTEGSTLGGAFLRPILARTFGFEDERGTRYYAPYGLGAATHWAAFKQRMDEAVAPADHDAVVAEARRAFRAFSRILSSINASTTVSFEEPLAAE